MSGIKNDNKCEALGSEEWSDENSSAGTATADFFTEDHESVPAPLSVASHEEQAVERVNDGRGDLVDAESATFLNTSLPSDNKEPSKKMKREVEQRSALEDVLKYDRQQEISDASQQELQSMNYRGVTYAERRAIADELQSGRRETVLPSFQEDEEPGATTSRDADGTRRTADGQLMRMVYRDEERDQEGDLKEAAAGNQGDVQDYYAQGERADLDQEEEEERYENPGARIAREKMRILMGMSHPAKTNPREMRKKDLEPSTDSSYFTDSGGKEKAHSSTGDDDSVCPSLGPNEGPPERRQQETQEREFNQPRGGSTSVTRSADRSPVQQYSTAGRKATHMVPSSERSVTAKASASKPGAGNASKDQQSERHDHRDDEKQEVGNGFDWADKKEEEDEGAPGLPRDEGWGWGERLNWNTQDNRVKTMESAKVMSEEAATTFIEDRDRHARIDGEGRRVDQRALARELLVRGNENGVFLASRDEQDAMRLDHADLVLVQHQRERDFFLRYEETHQSALRQNMNRDELWFLIKACLDSATALRSDLLKKLGTHETEVIFARLELLLNVADSSERTKAIAMAQFPNDFKTRAKIVDFHIRLLSGLGQVAQAKAAYRENLTELGNFAEEYCGPPLSLPGDRGLNPGQKRMNTGEVVDESEHYLFMERRRTNQSRANAEAEEVWRLREERLAQERVVAANPSWSQVDPKESVRADGEYRRKEAAEREVRRQAQLEQERQQRMLAARNQKNIEEARRLGENLGRAKARGAIDPRDFPQYDLPGTHNQPKDLDDKVVNRKHLQDLEDHGVGPPGTAHFYVEGEDGGGEWREYSDQDEEQEFNPSNSRHSRSRRFQDRLDKEVLESEERAEEDRQKKEALKRKHRREADELARSMRERGNDDDDEDWGDSDSDSDDNGGLGGPGMQGGRKRTMDDRRGSGRHGDYEEREGTYGRNSENHQGKKRGGREGDSVHSASTGWVEKKEEAERYAARELEDTNKANNITIEILMSSLPTENQKWHYPQGTKGWTLRKELAKKITPYTDGQSVSMRAWWRMVCEGCEDVRMSVADRIKFLASTGGLKVNHNEMVANRVKEFMAKEELENWLPHYDAGREEDDYEY